MGISCCSGKNDTTHSHYSRTCQYFFDNYTLAQTIGKGSNGEVKLAYHNITHNKVAVKIVDKAQTIKSATYQNVLQQKFILQQVINPSQFPFTSRLVECSQDRSKLYFVLEYLPFGNLRKLITTKRMFNIDQIKFLCICLLLALNFLSQNNVIHGDLKPQNILIDDKGYFCLADFSSARLYGCWSSQIKGTKGYIAAEIKSDTKTKINDNSSDLYSLGTILWEMAYGMRYCQYRKVEERHEMDLTGQSSSSDGSVHCEINDPLFEDFLALLLKENPYQRPSIETIWEHPWLKPSLFERDTFMSRQVTQHPFAPVEEYFSYTRKQSVLSFSRTYHDSMECGDVLYRSVLLDQRKYQDVFASFTQPMEGKHSRLKIRNTKSF